MMLVTHDHEYATRPAGYVVELMACAGAQGQHGQDGVDSSACEAQAEGQKGSGCQEAADASESGGAP